MYQAPSNTHTLKLPVLKPVLTKRHVHTARISSRNTFISQSIEHQTRSLSPQAFLQIAPFLFDVGAVLDLLGWGQFLPCAFV